MCQGARADHLDIHDLLCLIEGSTATFAGQNDFSCISDFAGLFCFREYFIELAPPRKVMARVGSICFCLVGASKNVAPGKHRAPREVSRTIGSRPVSIGLES